MEGISKDTLHYYAYTNSDICASPVRGIVLDFHGLGGGGQILHEHGGHSRGLAAEGILYVFPYYGPWSWMNKTAVNTVDAVVDALFDKHILPDGTPIISTGGSMGGLSALVYTRYAKRTPSACAANCPVCDLVFHATEREDLPRTVHHAFSGYGMPLEDAIKTSSPLHLAAEMPGIPYLIVHCEQDTAVNIHNHSERFVEAMHGTGHKVEYMTIPDRGHCDLSAEGWERYNGFILSHIRNKNA